MHHRLLHFYHWCTHTALGHWLANSSWGFAVVETFHVLGLTLLLGCVFVMNASVLGLRVSPSPKELAAELKPYWVASLLVMLSTGIPMFMSAADYYAPNPAFAIKMSLLLAAIALQLLFFIVPAIYQHSRWSKPLACLTLLCWFGIAYAGRAIAFTNLFGF